MNYEIVKSKPLLDDFIRWLPDLKQNETYYCCLFARSKYAINNDISHIKSDKAQLKRFTSSKDLLYYKIKQLECELGSYRQKGNVVPQECLALYITVNPRDMLKATRTGLIKLANLLGVDYNGHNPHQEIMSEIQKAKSRTVYVDFDFDGCSALHVKKQIFHNDILNQGSFRLLETRGGCHVLVNIESVSPQYRKSFYNKLSALDGCDQTGDVMIPVVGCTQGNFVPNFYM